jgi:hypothetical protein
MAVGDLWEQREDESDAAYVRFLIYRSLGPARSLVAAYQVVEPKATKRNKKQQGNNQQVSGQWTKDSAQFDWPARASAWDVQMLTEVGRETVINFLNALKLASEKTVAALSNEKIRPTSWRAALEAVILLGSFIPSETVARIQSDASDNRAGVTTAGAGTEQTDFDQ